MRSIAFLASSLLLTLLLVIEANAALSQPKLSYVLKTAKLALSTVDGSSRLSKEFSTHADHSKNTPPFDLAKPTQLENDDVIRLSFSLGVQDISGKEVAGSKDGPALGKNMFLIRRSSCSPRTAERKHRMLGLWLSSPAQARSRGTW